MFRVIFKVMSFIWVGIAIFMAIVVENYAHASYAIAWACLNQLWAMED